jgi:hypothetical protein
MSEKNHYQISMGCAASLIIGILLAAVGCYIYRKQQPTVFELTRDLPAYTIVGEKDFQAVHRISAPAGATTEASSVEGHMTVVPLKRHGILLDRELAKLPFGNQTWVTLITIPATSAINGQPGQVLMLVGASEDSDVVERISNQAVLLTTQNGHAVLAVAPDEASRAAAYTTGKRHLMAIPVFAVPAEANNPASPSSDSPQPKQK